MYDMIKAQLGATVPFATFTGVEVTHVGDGEGAATLVQRGDIENHIGSVHAGAMFTLGEAASGAALAGAIAPMLMEVRPVAANATIHYTKIAKGTLTATAKTSVPGAEIISTLRDAGKIKFDVNVAVTDADNVEVGSLTVAWYVSKNR